MKMDFMNMSPVLQAADRKLHHYIWNAGYHLEEADSYLEMMCIKGIPANMADHYHDMKDFYEALSRCDLNAARSLLSWLQEMDLIDLDDWRTMNHTLMWMGYSQEDRL